MMIVDSKVKALSQVKRFIESEKRIPQLPQILLRVEAALENPEIGGRELGRAILDDPSLTTQVLKVANSTFYNPLGTKITTVSRAIVILGFDNIRHLVLGLSVSKMFTLLPRWTVYRRLWRHSLATALLAQELSRADGFKEIEAAFIGGLLHDIGKLIIGHLHGEVYAGILEESGRELDFDLCQAENEAFYCTHQEVGSLLAHSWGLPPELVRIIGRHRPGADWRNFTESLPGLAAYVIMANQMAHLLDLQDDDSTSDEFENESRYQQKVEALSLLAGSAFAINEVDFKALLENLADEITDVAASLDIALDDLRLDSGAVAGSDSGRIVKKRIDREELFEVTMKLSELAVLHEEFSAYVEATAGQLFTALGLELLIVYLPGSKGRGLAPGFCYGSGRPAEILGRMAISVDQDNLIRQVFTGGEFVTGGKLPAGAAELETEFQSPGGRVLALPLQHQGTEATSGVLLLLRNQKTTPFNDEEKRLLKLYCSFLGARLGPGSGSV
ncbi:MAG: HDOD domain-containing protein [Deltaproteobacteria bacterium]|nr:HDOD domain-containing protein [Candidatus Tharpella sp.]